MGAEIEYVIVGDGVAGKRFLLAKELFEKDDLLKKALAGYSVITTAASSTPLLGRFLTETVYSHPFPRHTPTGRVILSHHVSATAGTGLVILLVCLFNGLSLRAVVVTLSVVTVGAHGACPRPR